MSDICPTCGVLNEFCDFDAVDIYICQSCGETVAAEGVVAAALAALNAEVTA